MIMMPVSTRSRVDGRHRRSEHTRLRIIAAYLTLLRQKTYAPTAEQIARAAGCCTRTVFVRYADLPSITIAAAEVVFAEGAELAKVDYVGADRQARLRVQVETRAWLCERWLPLWRALMNCQIEAGALQAKTEHLRGIIFRRLALVYDPELSGIPEADRQPILIALEALTDFESWARMREGHGLSVEAACNVWVGVIDRLLPPTPAGL